MEFNLDYLFYAVFAIVAGSFIYKLTKHGGFRGAMFGATIKNTIGEVSGSGPKLMSLSMRVHESDGPREKAVGLELVAKSLASYQMTPITLSVSEANKLTVLIDRATNGKRGT